MLECIDQFFKSKISYSEQNDKFLSVSGTALQALLRAVESRVESCFTSMIRKAWSSIESVGDQSDYISQIGTVLSDIARSIRKHLNSPKFFKSFCDKFAELILTKYLNNIYKCRPMSEIGAEQVISTLFNLRCSWMLVR